MCVRWEVNKVKSVFRPGYTCALIKMVKTIECESFINSVGLATKC